MGNASFVAGKRKYLFCADQKGKVMLQPIIDLVTKKNLPSEFVLIESDQNQVLVTQKLFKWLSNQKMGSYLYMVAHWHHLKAIKPIAEDIGFSEEEAQYIGHGEQEKQVFCCRCHGMTKIVPEKTEVNCMYCDLLLEISDHYSRLRDAYLGFVAKL